jgi:hypothetical protein
MATCNEYVVPVQIEDFCNGEKTNAKCVVSTDAYTLLGLPSNSSLDVILNAFVVAISAQKTRIDVQDLLIADLESRIETLELP